MARRLVVICSFMGASSNMDWLSGVNFRRRHSDRFVNENTEESILCVRQKFKIVQIGLLLELNDWILVCLCKVNIKWMNKTSIWQLGFLRYRFSNE